MSLFRAASLLPFFSNKGDTRWIVNNVLCARAYACRCICTRMSGRDPRGRKIKIIQFSGELQLQDNVLCMNGQGAQVGSK